MAAGAYRHQGQSALWLWTLALIAGWGARELWAVGQMPGEGLACLGSALLAVMCVRLSWSGLEAHDTRQLLKRVQRASRKRPDVLGKAESASRKVTRRAGMEKPGGIFLGEHPPGRELFFHGEGSVTVIAPPGAGKTTAFAIANLLRLPLGTSALVLDPKLEQYAVCKADLERRGFRVLLISPWWETFAEEFGGRVDSRDDGFDLCSFLDPSNPSVIDHCTLLASLLIPQPPKGGTETEDFFRDFSISILVAFMLLELDRAGSVTLPRLRRMVMAPEEQVEADIAAMLASEAFSGVLAEYGARLYSPKMNAPKEWSGGVSGAMKALRLYDAHGPLGRSVEKAGVDFRTVKDGKTVVFFAQPAETMDTHKGYTAAVLILAMEMLARDRRKAPAILLADEIQNTPAALVPVLKGIALYRGTGLQFICLFQFLAAIKRHVGDAWREFLSVDVVAAMGVPADPETLQILSRLSGETTARTSNYSSDAQRLALGELSAGMSSHEVARPLLTSDDIRTMDQSEMLVFVRGMPLIRARKQSYLNNKELRRRASPNPYYV